MDRHFPGLRQRNNNGRLILDVQGTMERKVLFSELERPFWNTQLSTYRPSSSESPSSLLRRKCCSLRLCFHKSPKGRILDNRLSIISSTLQASHTSALQSTSVTTILDAVLVNLYFKGSFLKFTMSCFWHSDEGVIKSNCLLL